MYKAIIFDLDGTLLDTLDDLASAVNYALRKKDLPTRTREEVRSFVGNGILKLMERSAGADNISLAPELLQEFKGYYGAHCADETKPYDGVTELLKALKNQGFYTAVVSNKADFAVKKLAEFYFKDLLDLAVGENEEKGIKRKPDPASLLAVMKELGVKKSETVYIGDSEVDIQTAENAEVDCISVSWGFKDRAFLEENGAKCLVNSVEELRKIL